MNILITGGAGFIGSHYADSFIEHGHNVTIFDKNPQIHEFRARYVQGNLQDRSAIDDEVRKCDFVIHAAGVLGTHETVSSASDTVTQNIIGGLNVLDSVHKFEKNLINISKPNVWLNPYSITKDCMEKFCFMYAKEFKTKVAILKLYNVYGPRQKYSKVQKALPTWIVSALSGKPVEIFGTGTATMDLVHVRDVCNGTLAVVENFDKCCILGSDNVAADVWSNFPTYNSQILEIGSGKEISVRETIKILGQVLETDLQMKYLPMRRGEIDGTHLCADIARIAELTGYQARVGLDEGLRDTIDFYRENLPLIHAGKL